MEKKESLQDTVRAQILAYISNMDFASGTRLLSENQLAMKFRVSRSTIRSVLDALEAEGKIIRKQGSGTYVNTDACHLETILYPRIGMRTLIEKNGFQPTSCTIKVAHTVAGVVAEILNCAPDAPIQEVHSLYMADGCPCMYCIDKLPIGTFEDDVWQDEKMHSKSLYTSLRNGAEINVSWDVIRFRSAACTDIPEIAKYLKKEGEPNQSLTNLQIINYDEASHPILFGNIYVNTDLIRMHLIRDISKLD